MVYVGKSYPIHDALDKATGRTVYAGDMELKGMLHMAVLFSKIPHGFVKKLDYSKAMELPGVVDVLYYGNTCQKEHNRYHSQYRQDLIHTGRIFNQQVRFVGEGECGACTVIIDGEAMHSCLVLACQPEGKSVLTIEGLEENGELDKIQKIFIEEIAIQCGYCTTGMIMSTKALLMHNPHPTETEIRNALAGNICRCSGYTQILRAVKKTSEEA